MYIDNDTKLRVNINAPYKGFSRLDTPEIRAAASVVEIPDPTPPEDYAEFKYYRTEQQEAPYVVYTRKSDEQIYQYLDAQCTQRRAAAYAETDALFFKEQRGELAGGTWKAAVAAVKAEFPRPVKPEVQNEQGIVP